MADDGRRRDQLVATVALVTGVIPNFAAAAPAFAIGLAFYTVAVSTPTAPVDARAPPVVSHW